MNDTYVIDGNNVCGWYENVHHEFSIIPLLSLMMALLENGDNFYCIFDASISHKLKKHGRVDESEFIEKLLSDYPNNFFRVTGSSRADGTVLHCADHYKIRIITNDLFRDYIEKYPWLEERFSPRLIQGNLQPNGLLTIDKLPYGHLELQDDFASSSKRLIELLLSEKTQKKAGYEFHSNRNTFKESKSSPQPDTKCDTSSRKHRSELKSSYSKTSLTRPNQNIDLHIGILIAFLFIGVIAIWQTWDWGINYKISKKHQEIFNLGDQIKHEEAKIKSIKEKYSTIRFWQKKTREDIIDIEKAETTIKILDEKRSEAEDERTKLKNSIGRNWGFKPIMPPWTSPIFIPWIIISAFYFLYILAISALTQKN